MGKLVGNEPFAGENDCGDLQNDVENCYKLLMDMIEGGIVAIFFFVILSKQGPINPLTLSLPHLVRTGSRDPAPWPTTMRNTK
jgi:hypothetical protein